MPITLNGTTGIAGVDGSASTPAVQGSDTNTGVFYPAADTVGVSTGGSERMRVDSSGNVGIGTSSPTYKLDVLGSATGDFVVRGSTGRGNIITNTGAADASGILVGTTTFLGGASTSGSSESRLSLIASGTEGSTANNRGGNIQFYTKQSNSNTLTEAMRIDSSGNLLVGATSTTSNQTGLTYDVTGNGVLRIFHPNGSASGAVFQSFQYNGSGIGSITQNGTTAVAYNTTSDYRLKTNVVPLSGALVKIAALKPSEFDWIDGRHDDGFIAHEIQAVLPNTVTGDKDAVEEDGKPKYQQVDYSKIVVHLVAAVQELSAKVDAQAAEIAALKANAPA